ncbi:MAG TPA: hypothetical protein VEQ58_02535, partial [Polyangiaceae bacterium]|nr:hypothetical protein [Polyangiaceae bacterium]
SSAGMPVSGGVAAGGTASQGASGASGSVGASGTTGASGASGATGTVPNGLGTAASVHTICDVFCAQFNRCSTGGGNFGGDCPGSCWSAVYIGASPSCTATGENMLACLSTADQTEMPACADAFTSATDECAEQVAAYQACDAENRPKSSPRLCSEFLTGGSTTTKCTDDLRCLDGNTYSIGCNDSSKGDGQSDCVCQRNGEQQEFTVNDVSPNSCLYHLCIDLGD